MPRRIVSLWLPRLAAERMARRLGGIDAPFAVVAEDKGALALISLNRAAEAAGLMRGMGLTDARAVLPGLLTRPAEPQREADFLAALARWATRFSPWVAPDQAEPGTGALALDVTGCAHLFGGEAAILAEMEAQLSDMGLTARAALADTRGAAWALARFGGQAATPARDGDDIAQDAHATRVRAPRRKNWAKQVAARAEGGRAPSPRIAQPGETRAAISALPVAALRISPEAATGLSRLGLRTIGDLTLLPRAALARRFGTATVRRLDQALGSEPEPVSPLPAEAPLSARLSLPEPVGRTEDVAAALDRLLRRLCQRLQDRRMGARRLRLTVSRVDGADQSVEIGLARPSRDPMRIAPLFTRKIEELDAGFGIDAVRLIAVEAEPLAPVQHAGHLEAGVEGRARLSGGESEGFAELLGRIGNRIGFERMTRPLPADSHIPEKAFSIAAAAYSDPADGWPAPPGPRPISIFRPEPLDVTDPAIPPRSFRWRGLERRLAIAFGPERIAPEWWLDDPEWRSGPRDYWRVETETGARIWIFRALRAPRAPYWFAHGEFA